MSVMLVHLLIRTIVFGIALTFAMNRTEDVKVVPKKLLPLVALVFAILNAVLYHLLAPALNMVTLWSLWFAVPFVANGLLLLLTDKLVKQFRIEGLMALVKTSGIVTIAHLALHLIRV
jgi:uncharacterized membrane protein YvlD (DUF360 family)